MPIGKIGQRRQVVIPKVIFDALGLQTGDFVEVTKVKRTVVIKPKKVVDLDEILTRQQQAVLNARLAEAEEDVRVGRISGPFRTVDKLKRHLNAVDENNADTDIP